MSRTDALIDKVEKLLALAGSSNVHEAALAAARAQALIDAHRLEGLLAARAEAQKSVEQVEKIELERAKRPRKWRAALAAGLAAQQGCMAWSAELGRETALMVAGAADDLRVVQTLFGWLAPRLEWLSATHGAGRDRDWHEAFRVGAAEEVLRRLSGPPPAAAEEAPGAALLRADALARAERVEGWAEQHLKLRPGRGLRVDAQGYARGQREGAAMALPATGAGLQRS